MPSKYQPQVPEWLQDLYKGVYTKQLPLSNNKKLRYANDDYCELSRCPKGMRGYLRWFIVIIIFFTCLLFICSAFFAIYAIIYVDEIRLLAIFLECIFILISYFFIQIFLCGLFAPEDCPIRLNRKTRKVYIYENIIMHLGAWRALKYSPFKIKEVIVKEFDWMDIQGVMSSILASVGTVRTYRIECVVCKPNTTNVIDHFILCTDSSLSYDEWMWINSYMAFSDNNLDRELMPEEEFTWPIKVNWPEEIDKKSKASSLEEYQKIDAEYKKIKE
ncbi:DUF6708 domain-containing protein [Gilliamella sp. Occ4-3]|uniref:DUF6708 domain-containing protein n=2 Tax=unclassified Gilliamella TaxID=2685620 RepID=UPI00080E20B4|nr:DUF6708 domain-containing protein [Gilliamella apicola]OCG79300.1 hypothetical protein A9G44_12470 [Gilliamella apicola]